MHSAIRSPVFELVKTVEVDFALGDETWPTRFEILRDTERPNHFRCHIWQLEFFRIQSTFPQSDGRPTHQPSDHRLILEWEVSREGDYDNFVAADADAALKKVIEDFRRFLERMTRKKAT